MIHATVFFAALLACITASQFSCTASTDASVVGTANGTIYCINGGSAVVVADEECACINCDDNYGGVSCADAVLCQENEYVLDNTCVNCPNNSTNPAGDNPIGADTTCGNGNSTSNSTSSSNSVIETVTISFTVSGDGNLDDDAQAALLDAVLNLLETQGILSEGSIVIEEDDNGDLTVEIILDVDTEDTQLSDTTEFLNSEEFADEIASEVETLGFAVEGDIGVDDGQGTPAPEDSSGLSTGVVIAIIVGVIVFLVLMNFAYTKMCKAPDDEPEGQQGMPLTQRN